MPIVRNTVPPTLPSATRRTPKGTRATKSAATKRSGCSWTVSLLSIANDCSSAPARPRAVLKDAGRQSCLIALTKRKLNPTVWNYSGCAVWTLCAGEQRLKIRVNTVWKGVMHLFCLFETYCCHTLKSGLNLCITENCVMTMSIHVWHAKMLYFFSAVTFPV